MIFSFLCWCLSLILPTSCSPPRNPVKAVTESEGGLVNTFCVCCWCVFSLEGMPRGCFSMGRVSVNKQYNGSPLFHNRRWHTLKCVWNVCVWVFVFLGVFFLGWGGTWIPSYSSLSGDRERESVRESLCVCVCVREREATPNPMGRQWVMNYSLSESQHWCYHRACHCTGMTAVTAPRKDLALTSDTSS